MRVLVTGAAGMLGRRVAQTARERGHEVAAVTHEDVELTDAQAVFDLLGTAAPDAVVHCAAHTDVDGAEADEQAAQRVNAQAASHVAAAAARNGAFLVALSTDYVFDGTRDGDRPYVESDEPRPLGAYGRSKLAGEQAVADAGGPHAIVRTAWLFGAGGRNFVDTMLELASRQDEVRVVDDQRGSPTWTGLLAPALVTVAERRAAGIHHIAGTGSCSWRELAQEVFRQAGASCRVVPVTTREMPRPAPRPACSALASERPDAIELAPWPEHVAGYLRERGS